jgi:hypothetical protein
VLDVETKPVDHPARRAGLGRQDPRRACSGCCRELNVDAEGIEIGPSPQEADTSPPSRCRSRSWTSPSGPTTASSARASTPSASWSGAARPTCSTSATSVRSRSTRSR